MKTKTFYGLTSRDEDGNYGRWAFGVRKTTLSKLLADWLGFQLFSSGIIYRSVAYLCVSEGLSFEESEKILQLLRNKKLSLVLKEQEARLHIDGVELAINLYTSTLSDGASRVSKHPELRRALLELQRNAFPGVNLIAEGRDMGSVVFPDAKIKFFIQTDEEVRVSRRLSQLGASGAEHIGKEIIERDLRDQTRLVAPAVPAKDAFIIDNSRDPLEIVFARMCEIVLSHGLRPI